MPHELCLTNARIVTADAVVLGHIYIENGVIKDMAEGSLPALHKQNGCLVEDCQGEYLLPGLVELHTDNLEKHLMPRPSGLRIHGRSARVAKFISW